jgi:hypothetical protein
LIVQDGAGRGLRTLGVWPGLERARLRVKDEVWRLPVPNARSVVYGSRGSTTVIGVSDSIDLTILDGTTPSHRFVAAARRRAATQTERSAWERTIERDHPDEAPEVLAAEQHVPLNDFLPDVGGVVVDAERNVWVGNYAAAGDSTRIWVVYTPEGKARGAVELPTFREALVPWRTELLDVYGDRLAVLRGDTPGARYVEVRQLVKR